MIESYKDLTIKKYQELRKVLDEPAPLLDMQASIIAVLSDASVDEVLNLPLGKYEDLVSKTWFINEKPQLDGRIPDKIVITTSTGEKLECRVVKDIDKITAAQYIDYQTLAAKEDKDGNIANILACFIVPKGMKYCDGYDVAEVINWLNGHMNMYDALNICFFFRKKYLRSIKATLISLRLMMKMMRMREKNQELKEKMEKAITDLKTLYLNLRDNGDGLIW